MNDFDFALEFASLFETLICLEFQGKSSEQTALDMKNKLDNMTEQLTKERMEIIGELGARRLKRLEE